MSQPQPKVIFAQLCKELTTIEDATKHHVYELYYDISNVATYPFHEWGEHWDISANDFLNTFFGCPRGGYGAFRLSDCSGAWMYLDNWKVLDYPFVTPGNAVKGVDLSFNSCSLLTLIPNQWAIDISNTSTCCWTACSLMGIQKELLEANALCNWDCDVCCSMTTGELAKILNHQDPSGNRTATSPIRSTGSISHTTDDGDRLVLAILFTNDHPQADPIELRLNFKIN